MVQAKPAILIADREAASRKLLTVTLEAAGFKVIEAESGNELLMLAGAHKPDAVIMDMDLPDQPGLEVMAKLREWSQMPVLAISTRDDAEEIVEIFETGADDFMAKPLHTDVLMARLQAALRHGYQQEVGDSILQAGDITIDLVRHEVRVGGELIEFTPKEYELLSYLMRHEGKMLTHKQILKDVWGAAHAHDKQYLRVYIMQLRQKIEEDVDNPQYIVTDTGIGYRFDALPPEASKAQGNAARMAEA